VVLIVKRAAGAAGLSSAELAGHSLRAGLAARVRLKAPLASFATMPSTTMSRFYSSLRYVVVRYRNAAENTQGIDNRSTQCKLMTSGM
jgi:hypothetical protein